MWVLSAQTEEAPWFYTVNDCHLHVAVKRPWRYCKETHDPDCVDARDGVLAAGAAVSNVHQIGRAYREFAEDEGSWMAAYALGHCKLNAVGAQFVRNAAGELYTLKALLRLRPAPTAHHNTERLQTILREIYTLSSAP